jgi:catalase
MPLPSDERILALSEALLAALEGAFGQHPGIRPAHAKGLLLEGTFTPSPEAARLSRAPHFSAPSTPVFVRFSNGTGIPDVPDGNPNGNPKGMAIRFMLGPRRHTDIISHGVDGFPVRNGNDFLEFLRAAGAGKMGEFLAVHPESLPFVQAPKPTPASFATQNYFGVTAMRFENSAGEARFGRYRIVPVAGESHLDDADAQGRAPDFLFDEIRERVGSGPAAFELRVQLAENGDVVDDATQHWPEERTVLTLGRIELTGVAADNSEQQRHMIFDPIPRVEGIEPSADPLLELRAAVYLISGRKRREAGASTASV